MAPSSTPLTSSSTIFYLTTAVYTAGALVGGTDVHQEWDKTEEENEKEITNQKSPHREIEKQDKIKKDENPV